MLLLPAIRRFLSNNLIKLPYLGLFPSSRTYVAAKHYLLSQFCAEPAVKSRECHMTMRVQPWQHRNSHLSGVIFHYVNKPAMSHMRCLLWSQPLRLVLSIMPCCRSPSVWSCQSCLVVAAPPSVPVNYALLSLSYTMLQLNTC